MALTIKYVSMQGKAAWYNRRYPVCLLDRVELRGRKILRKRIKSDPVQQPVQFAQELQQLNHQFERYCSYLQSGSDESVALDQMPAPKNVSEQPLLVDSPPEQRRVKYEDLVQSYISYAGLSEYNKRDRAHMKLMNDFSRYISAVTMEGLRDALLAYVADNRASIAESSLSRYISVIVKPVAHHNDFIRNHDDRIVIMRPKLKDARPSKPLNRKKPLNHTEQHKLMKSLGSMKPWQEFFVLLAMQTGANISETQQLTTRSFNFTNSVPLVCIGGEGTIKKTDERERMVPLVLGVERIKELIDLGVLEELSSKTADNISAQLSEVLNKVIAGSSSYSLRHTLRHNLVTAMIPVDIQSELGGWIGKGSTMSESHAGYGELGKDYNERLLTRSDALAKAFAHLGKVT